MISDNRQIEDVHARHVAGRLDLVVGGRDDGRQGRGRGQALDGQAVLGGFELVFLAVDDNGDVTRRAAPFGVDLIGLARIGQGFRRRTSLEGHHAVTGDQQQGAEGHGLARADEAVRHDAAQQRQQIDQRSVGAIGRPRHGVVEQEVLRQEEDQDSAHAVVGEPLPHLGEEQDDQSARVVLEDLHHDRHAGREGDDQPEGDDDIHTPTPHRSPLTQRVSRAPPMSVCVNGSLLTAAPSPTHERRISSTAGKSEQVLRPLWDSVPRTQPLQAQPGVILPGARSARAGREEGCGFILRRTVRWLSGRSSDPITTR